MAEKSTFFHRGRLAAARTPSFSLGAIPVKVVDICNEESATRECLGAISNSLIKRSSTTDSVQCAVDDDAAGAMAYPLLLLVRTRALVLALSC